MYIDGIVVDVSQEEVKLLSNVVRSTPYSWRIS